jgi:hypothetical protein
VDPNPPSTTRASSDATSTNDARFCALLPGVRVPEVADACRSAALAFAGSARDGWGRRELARWLVGPYAHAVAATRPLRASGTRRAVTQRSLDEETIEELLVRSRTELIVMLRSVWSWTHDPAFVRARIDEGLIAGVIDETSELGFAPLDRTGMRLVDRVRALFVADYLTRPADYAAFALCEDCDGATFDGGLYHVDCTRPRPRRRLRHRAPREVVLPADFAHPDLDDDDGPSFVTAASFGLGAR